MRASIEHIATLDQNNKIPLCNDVIFLPLMKLQKDLNGTVYNSDLVKLELKKMTTNLSNYPRYSLHRSFPLIETQSKLRQVTRTES